jgi:hypothetical protein
MESITLLISRGFYFFVKARRIGAGGSIGAAVKRIGSDGFVLTAFGCEWITGKPEVALGRRGGPEVGFWEPTADESTVASRSAIRK